LDCVNLGTQLQLFVAVLIIFFGKESVCTERLNNLLHLVGQNKKSFCNQFALEKFFAAKFLFAINSRVQRWLRMCEQVTISCTQVNDSVPDFDDLTEEILNESFQMNLPMSFKKIENKKIKNSSSKAPPTSPSRQTEETNQKETAETG
jgi:hypothetical protein